MCDAPLRASGGSISPPRALGSHHLLFEWEKGRLAPSLIPDLLSAEATSEPRAVPAADHKRATALNTSVLSDVFMQHEGDVVRIYPSV